MMIEPCGMLTISRQSFGHNVAYFRKMLPPGTQISAVVKANAYGHGLAHMLSLLQEHSIRWCSVFSLAEAAAVLQLAPSMSVHVLCPVSFRNPAVSDADRSINIPASAMEKIHLTVQDIASAASLNEMAGRLGQRISVQIQLDVGLTRQGCTPDDFAPLLQAVRRMRHLHLTAIFAHFSHGETPASAQSQHQYERFMALAGPLRKDGLWAHIHNSGGTVHNAPSDVDLVRIGIGLYGLQPSLDYPITELIPIAQLIAPVITIHHRPAGTGVGYGHQFITPRAAQIAILPVGYADGYRRELGAVANVEISGRRYPIVGRISMDQMAVDITGGDVHVGDTAVLISADSQSDIAMDQLARRCRTIGYELATGLGSRVRREVY